VQNWLNRSRCRLDRLTFEGQWNHVLDRGQDRTNKFSASRGDKSAMWPFAKFTLDTCYCISGNDYG